MTTNTSTEAPPIAGDTSLICNLPNELLLLIFHFASSGYDEQYRALSIISRACRHFHSLITPLLYCSFEDCCVKHLQLFGRTLFARKDRAALLRHFKGRQERDVDVPKRPGCNEYWDIPSTDPALMTVAREQLPDPSSKIPSLRFIAYALSCICPNIQWLHVTDGSQYLLARLHMQMDKKILEPANSFRKVHTLSISIEPDRSFELRNISLLFNQPSLRALTIRKASLTVQEEQEFAHKSVDESWLCDLRTSGIEELTFEECCLSIEWITAAINSCKTLKHFHHEYYHWLDDKDSYQPLFDALAHHKKSLQYLRINELHGCKRYSRDQLEPDKPISFKEYGSLTHVDIPLFLLSPKSCSRMIQDIFSSTLNVLTFDVRSAREGFSDAFFLSLAEAIHQYLPSLRLVEVICRIEQYNRNGYVPLHPVHVRRMFSSHGVEFVYFLEFVSCEFDAVYMKPILDVLRCSDPDGHDLADHSSLEMGCQGPCNSVSLDARQTERYWGYMQPWAGPSEFETVS